MSRACISAALCAVHAVSAIEIPNFPQGPAYIPRPAVAQAVQGSSGSSTLIASIVPVFPSTGTSGVFPVTDDPAFPTRDPFVDSNFLHTPNLESPVSANQREDIPSKSAAPSVSNGEHNDMDSQRLGKPKVKHKLKGDQTSMSTTNARTSMSTTDDQISLVPTPREATQRSTAPEVHDTTAREVTAKQDSQQYPASPREVLHLSVIFYVIYFSLQGFLDKSGGERQQLQGKTEREKEAEEREEYMNLVGGLLRGIQERKLDMDQQQTNLEAMKEEFAKEKEKFSKEREELEQEKQEFAKEKEELEQEKKELEQDKEVFTKEKVEILEENKNFLKDASDVLKENQEQKAALKEKKRKMDLERDYHITRAQQLKERLYKKLTKEDFAKDWQELLDAKEAFVDEREEFLEEKDKEWAKIRKRKLEMVEEHEEGMIRNQKLRKRLRKKEETMKRDMIEIFKEKERVMKRKMEMVTMRESLQMILKTQNLVEKMQTDKLVEAIREIVMSEESKIRGKMGNDSVRVSDVGGLKTNRGEGIIEKSLLGGEEEKDTKEPSSEKEQPSLQDFENWLKAERPEDYREIVGESFSLARKMVLFWSEMNKDDIEDGQKTGEEKSHKIVEEKNPDEAQKTKEEKNQKTKTEKNAETDNPETESKQPQTGAEKLNRESNRAKQSPENISKKNVVHDNRRKKIRDEVVQKGESDSFFSDKESFFSDKPKKITRKDIKAARTELEGTFGIDTEGSDEEKKKVDASSSDEEKKTPDASDEAKKIADEGDDKKKDKEKKITDELDDKRQELDRKAREEGDEKTDPDVGQ